MALLGRAGYSTYFTNLDDMVRHLQAAADVDRLNHKTRTYTQPAVLVLDEIGYLPLDRAAANSRSKQSPKDTNRPHHLHVKQKLQ